MLSKHRYSERCICRALGIARSSIRYLPQPRSDEGPLRASIIRLAAQYGRYGYRMITALLHDQALRSVSWAAWDAGIVVAVVSNLINNLPTGLIAGAAVQSAHVPDQITRAVLIGVDLGPNLSVTGSLATILWLIALRREKVHLDGLTFLRLGALVMPPALVLALAVIVLQHAL